MTRLAPALARLLPGPARQLAADVWSRTVSASTARQLRALAGGRQPIVVGPWLGEVGFELLYWIPFLDWAVDRFGFDRRQLIVLSRGGTAAWYRHITTRYRDVFEFLGEDEFRAGNERRTRALGEQKQVRVTTAEQELAQRAAQAEGADAAALLHPSLMYAAYRPFWWGHQPQQWVSDRARFRRLPAPAERPAGLPARYVAAKFYFNEAFPATEANRSFIEQVVRETARHVPVVSLATGLRIDDHDSCRIVAQELGPLTAATNLGAQSAVVAGAEACLGTYGGFAYLAPLHGVPMRAYYSNPDGFSAMHLRLAQDVFAGIGPDLLTLTDVRHAPARAIAG